MKDTTIPLDIIFIDAECNVLDVKKGNPLSEYKRMGGQAEKVCQCQQRDNSKHQLLSRGHDPATWQLVQSVHVCQEVGHYPCWQRDSNESSTK